MQVQRNIMRSRESQSSDHRTHLIAIIAAVIGCVLITMAAAFFIDSRSRTLVLSNAKTGEVYARYPLKIGDTFGISFIHSVNKSPLTDYYEIRKDGIYVVKTVYYGFGAGVQTQLEGNEELSYGDDGSMIVTGFDRKMNDLIYIVGTVSDHTLIINDTTRISLRDLCGRNAMVRFESLRS